MIEEQLNTGWQIITLDELCNITHSSHAPRGNSSGNALRSVTQEYHWLHSHAERGNDISAEILGSVLRLI